MKQVSKVLAWIAGCAVLMPAATGKPARARAPRLSAAVILKRRQLARQHTQIAFRKYEEQDLGWAVRHFKEAIRLDPNNAGLHASLGGLYASRKRLRDAEQEFRLAARLEPRNTQHQERLGVVLERQDRPRDAAAIYKNVIWVDNRDASAHQHLGWVLERQGKTRDAIRAYQTALQLDPENLPARARLSRLEARSSAGSLAAAPARTQLARRPTSE